LSLEAWTSGDEAQMRSEAEGDALGSLLLGALDGAHTPDLLRDMHRLERASAPLWMRAEALRLMCECSCVMAWTDSLRRQGERYLALTGTPFGCPLAGPPPAAGVPLTGDWWVQCGAYSTERGAREALKALGRTGTKSRLLPQGGLWKVQLGPCPGRPEAERIAGELKASGRLKDYRLVEGGAHP